MSEEGLKTDHHKHFSALVFLKGINEDGERIDVEINKSDEDELLICWGKEENFESIYVSLSQFLNFLKKEDII